MWGSLAEIFLKVAREQGPLWAFIVVLFVAHESVWYWGVLRSVRKAKDEHISHMEEEIDRVSEERNKLQDKILEGDLISSLPPEAREDDSDE